MAAENERRRRGGYPPGYHSHDAETKAKIAAKIRQTWVERKELVAIGRAARAALAQDAKKEETK